MLRVTRRTILASAAAAPFIIIRHASALPPFKFGLTPVLLDSDIALQTGFYDQSHFTHQFVRHRGVTPSRYREKHGPRAEA